LIKTIITALFIILSLSSHARNQRKPFFNIDHRKIRILKKIPEIIPDKVDEKGRRFYKYLYNRPSKKSKKIGHFGYASTDEGCFWSLDREKKYIKKNIKNITSKIKFEAKANCNLFVEDLGGTNLLGSKVIFSLSPDQFIHLGDKDMVFISEYREIGGESWIKFLSMNKKEHWLEVDDKNIERLNNNFFDNPKTQKYFNKYTHHKYNHGQDVLYQFNSNKPSKVKEALEKAKLSTIGSNYYFIPVKQNENSITFSLFAAREYDLAKILSSKDRKWISKIEEGSCRKLVKVPYLENKIDLTVSLTLAEIQLALKFDYNKHNSYKLRFIHEWDICTSDKPGDKRMMNPI